ncbi:hypothetical protein C0995_004948 [Termitomyces sp. Mi166|nr:hypothetical protein C0995_004948 [Termitomyces sp. Mi166\
MAPKISLLHVTADSSLLEHKCATQEFISAANAVFFKAQGLAMLVPLHEMVFGLLEGLLDDWRLLNSNSVEWPCKAEVHQACVNLWSLNKQVPWLAEFGKTVVSWKHAISTIEQIKLMHFEKMVIELEPTVPIVVPKSVVNPAPTHVSATLSIQHAPFIPYIADPSSPPMHHLVVDTKTFLMAKQRQWKSPPLSILVVAKHIKLVQVAKAFLKQQGKSSQFFVLEGYKKKRKAKALLGDSEQAGAKRSFKSMELVDSDSDEEEEEDRVHIIKKVKCEHVEELTGTRKRKEIIELDEEVEIVVPKTPVAGPLCQTSKPIVLVPSMPKPVPKLIIALASPVAGPSTAPIVPSSAPKPAAATALSKPASVKSARPAIKEGFIFKDPFMVRQFKLVGTEESGVLIINQATEVPATQGTMQSEESSNEDGQGDDDDSDNGNVAMDVDSAKHPEET